MGAHSVEEPTNPSLGSVEEDNQTTSLRSLDRFELAHGKPEDAINPLTVAGNGDQEV